MSETDYYEKYKKYKAKYYELKMQLGGTSSFDTIKNFKTALNGIFNKLNTNSNGRQAFVTTLQSQIKSYEVSSALSSQLDLSPHKSFGDQIYAVVSRLRSSASQKAKPTDF